MIEDEELVSADRPGVKQLSLEPCILANCGYVCNCLYLCIGILNLDVKDDEVAYSAN